MTEVSLVNGHIENVEHCVCCGEVIPEGGQYCWKCGNESENYEPKKQTNYDRIKTMNVEELANVFYFGIDKICFDNCAKSTDNKFKCPIEDDVTPENCKECIKKWLESEVTE